MRSIKADEILIREGQSGDTLYKVVKGSFTLFFNYGKSEEFLVGVVAKGKCIGDISFLTGDKSLYTVVANEDSVVLDITKDNFQDFVVRYPQNAVDFITGLGKVIKMYNKHIEMLTAELEDKEKSDEKHKAMLSELTRKAILPLYSSRTYDSPSKINTFI